MKSSFYPSFLLRMSFFFSNGLHLASLFTNSTWVYAQTERCSSLMNLDFGSYLVAPEKLMYDEVKL